MILIKPKIGNEKGRAYIATGYGMEEIIPDAVARRIVDNEMIPYFKNNRYYKGINAALEVVFDLAAGRYKADEYYQGESPWAGIIFIVIFFLFIILSAGRQSRYRGSSIGHNIPFWFLLGMMSGGVAEAVVGETFPPVQAPLADLAVVEVAVSVVVVPAAAGKTVNSIKIKSKNAPYEDVFYRLIE